jgi:hypothetical protein
MVLNATAALEFELPATCGGISERIKKSIDIGKHYRAVRKKRFCKMETFPRVKCNSERLVYIAIRGRISLRLWRLSK